MLEGTRLCRRILAGASTLVGLAGIGLLAASASVAAPADRVVGGTASTSGQYPWQVAVALNDSRWKGDAYARQFCGGTLLAPTIVLTAAHCVYNQPVDGIGVNSPKEFEVFTGRTFLSQAAGQVIDVAAIHVPMAKKGGSAKPKPEAARDDQPRAAASPLFNPTTHEWDVALLQLTSPSISAPIQIAGPTEAAVWAGGRPVQVSGWGSVNSPRSAPVKPDQLHSTTLAMVNDADCNASRAPFFSSSVMTCAGSPAGGRGACYGDSGGPLVALVEVGPWIGIRLVGATSLVGADDVCGSPYPDMYTRVADDPIRAYVQATVQQLAGVNPIGAGARPLAPPRTKIAKAKLGRRAHFRLTASEPAGFRCRLDHGRYRKCKGSVRFKVGVGRHKLRAVAIDQLGQRDPTPAVRIWRVERR